MRVMVLVKATADSETGLLPSAQLLADMGRYNERLAAAGIMLAGEGLKASSVGRRVAFDGEDRTVTPGPFAATSELVAGFWIWQVKDMDEAVEWVKRCPNPMPGPSEIEIRQIFEASDFDEAMTPQATGRINPDGGQVGSIEEASDRSAPSDADSTIAEGSAKPSGTPTA